MSLAKVIYGLVIGIAVYGVTVSPSHLWAALFVALGTLAAGMIAA